MYQMPVMINVCTNITPFTEEIKAVSWSLPNKHGKGNCVLLYFASGCTGEHKKITRPDELRKFARKIKSLTIC